LLLVTGVVLITRRKMRGARMPALVDDPGQAEAADCMMPARVPEPA